VAPTRYSQGQMLEIYLSCWGYHKINDTIQKSIGKGKFTSEEGCAPDKESGKQTHWVKVHLDFISNTMLPLA
jgi:hypothetical protein